VAEHTDNIIKRTNVDGAFSHTIPIKDLSGGNQQKFVVGRELEKKHKILLAGHPTRGLDIKAIDNIYKNIIKNAKGKTTILFSLELSELLAVCDRVAVFHEGKIVKIIDPRNKEDVAILPSLMVGVNR
jgi:simple sugar transport system ATP-binding protein